MKNIIKFFVLAVVILGFSANSFAQTQTATATVLVIPATTMVKATNMDFGSIAQSLSPGTVILAPATGIASSSDGITVTGTSTAATFNLTGGPTQHFTFTIPTGTISTTTNPDGGTAMTIGTWTSSPNSVDGSGSGDLVSSNGAISVGATLHVGAAQVAGTYTTSTFNVTVNWP